MVHDSFSFLYPPLDHTHAQNAWRRAPHQVKGRIVKLHSRGKRPLHLSTVKREMSDTEEEVSMRDMEKREEGEKASLVRDPVRPAATLRQAAIFRPLCQQAVEADVEKYSYRQCLAARSFRLGLLISLIAVFLIVVTVAAIVTTLLG